MFKEKIGVYVINCDIHKKRLKTFKKYANKANLNYNRQRCVNGKKFTDSRILQMIDKGILNKNTKMTPIEVSINLSFVKVWQKIVNSNNDYGIILEDDTKINKNFINDINDILSSIKEHKSKFDVLYLHNGNFSYTKSSQKKILTTKNGIHILMETKGHNAGGPAYIITKKFAKYMLDKIFPIKEPHDMLMGYTRGKKFYTVKMKKNIKGCWEAEKLIVKVSCNGEYGTGDSTQDYEAETIKDIYKRIKHTRSLK